MSTRRDQSLWLCSVTVAALMLSSPRWAAAQTIADAGPDAARIADSAPGDASALDAKAEAAARDDASALDSQLPDATAAPPDAALIQEAGPTSVAEASPDAPTEPPSAIEADAAPAPTPPPPPRPTLPAPPAAPAAPAVQLPPWPLPVPPGGGQGGPELWDIAEKIFPVLPERQRSNAAAYVVLVVLSLSAAHLLGRARRRLPVSGLLPRTLALIQVLLRLLVVALTVGLVMRWIPASIWPALPWIVLAAAAALGWSARDFLPDLLGGIVLLVERRVRVGTWVLGEGFAGEVEGRGLRTTRLRDSNGRLLSIPNRKLTADTVVAETGRWPMIEVAYKAPSGNTPVGVRRALRDAVLLSPYRPVEEMPVIARDGLDSELWHVRVRLLEARFAQVFESALVDSVEEMLSGEQQPEPPTTADEPRPGAYVED